MRKYDYTLRDKAENEWRNFEIETNNEAIILKLASIEVIFIQNTDYHHVKSSVMLITKEFN